MSPDPRAFVKRSLTIVGPRTSLSLEAAFWRRLEAVAAARRLSLSALVAEVDAGRGEANLSSALRVFALESASALHLTADAGTPSPLTGEGWGGGENR